MALIGNPLPPINGVGSSATGTIIPATPAGSGLDEPVTKLDMEVNESLVGAVIGQGGRSIVEIQQCSGQGYMHYLYINVRLPSFFFTCLCLKGLI